MNILNKTKGLLLAATLVMLAGVRAIAQDVTFTAQAPKAVVVGERFRITYKVNTRDAKEFRAPDMKSIQILTGPATSTSSSTTTSGILLLCLNSSTDKRCNSVIFSFLIFFQQFLCNNSLFLKRPNGDSQQQSCCPNSYNPLSSPSSKHQQSQTVCSASDPCQAMSSRCQLHPEPPSKIL